jgi:hypothetical protein
MALWPNEIRELIYIDDADHGELYPALTHIKKIGNAGARGDSVELHAGIALLPDAHPSVQLVPGHLTEVSAQPL